MRDDTGILLRIIFSTLSTALLSQIIPTPMVASAAPALADWSLRQLELCHARLGKKALHAARDAVVSIRALYVTTIGLYDKNSVRVS